MKIEKLRDYSRKLLAELAKKKGIAGYQDMSKDALVAALKRKQAAAPAGRTARPAKTATKAKKAPVANHSVKAAANHKVTAAVPRVQKSAARNGSSVADEHMERSKFDMGIPTKDLSARVPKHLPQGYGKDRIVVMVRDPFWLHAYWELTRNAVERAEAALGAEWHGAKPIIRLLDVSAHDSTSTSESIVRDIEIHGGCNNWYIDVGSPPKSFRVDIGYLSPRGRFFVIARSNVVSTPAANVSDSIDQNWSDLDTRKADRIFAMSSGYDPSASSLEVKQLLEERLRRPMGSPSVTSFGSGAFGNRNRKFWFQIDAELIVYGSTEPNARVTLQGEPVKIRPDGTFTMRYSLPDSRQIIPAVAASADGVEERTIVLAVERNTKYLEPQIHDVNE